MNNKLIEGLRASRFAKPLLYPYRKGRNRWIHKRILNGENIPIPKSIAFEVTQRCNLNCKICFFRQNRTNAGLKEMTIEEIGFLFKKRLNKYSFRHCFLTGSEPFMRDDLEDIIEIIVKEGMKISFQTNATLITEERLNKILEYRSRITAIGTSCEGLESVHNIIRGGTDSFKKAINALEIFKNNDIRPNISVIVLDENLEDVVKLPELFLKYYIKQMDIGLVANYREDELKKSSLITGLETKEIHTLVSNEMEYKESPFKIKEMFRKTIESGKREGLKVLYSPALLNKDFEGIFNRTIRDNHLLTCSAFFSIRIAPDGSIIHCPFLRRSFGNSSNTPLDEIWNSREFKEFRKRLLASNMLPTCTRCGKLRERPKGVT